MSTTIRTAVISTLALFALLIAPSARADGFDITGHTNTAACNLLGPNSCRNVSFALVAQTEPYYSWFLVTSLTGEVNGQTITAPSPDGLLGNAGIGNSASGPIPFAPGGA